MLRAMTTPKHSQAGVAKALGISRQSVNLYAQGKVQPNATTLKMLAVLYGIPPEAWKEAVPVETDDA